MIDRPIKKFSFSLNDWFYLFLFVHLLCWSLVPAIVRYNLPMDSIEGTIWGHQLEWGYDKNPFLNGWLTALATFLDGHTGWLVYLFSQASVVICFYAVWKLAKHMLTPLHAFISVVLLECIQYYTFHAIDFNDNTLELSLWALTTYFFYRAVAFSQTQDASHQRLTFYWILTGLFAGLGMMAKYYTAALLAAMALFLFSTPANRQQLKTVSPYVGLLIFLIVIVPHCIWLFFHDFVTVTYVFDRTSSAPSPFNHLFFPAQFTWQQLQAFFPALLLALLLWMGKNSTARYSLSTFNRNFLIYVGLGPFLLTVGLSLLLGIKLRAGWGMPLLSLWGILLIAGLQPVMSKTKFSALVATIFILMTAMLGGYSFSLIDSQDPSSANFPGKEVAKAITQYWRDTYHTQLAYVAGSRWVGGNVEFYSNDHPAVFTEWNSRHAPWIKVTDLQKKGAIFLWDISNNETLPDAVKKQFPTLSTSKTLTFTWRRNRQNLPPIVIGVAILPPG